MKPIQLIVKSNPRGVRLCSFPSCHRMKNLIPCGWHCLCEPHYNFLIQQEQGENPPFCAAPDCMRTHSLEPYRDYLFCKKHLRCAIRESRTVQGTCYIDQCPRNGVAEYHGKQFCEDHFEKITRVTRPAPRADWECNYVGCDNPCTVSGFNNRWCPEHYLAICKIRDSITHDGSEAEVAARLKEIKVRKDSNTETGNRHRWYYLQLYVQSLSERQNDLTKS